MSFWIRDATLVIGNNKYTLDGLNFSFEIPFEDSDEPPVATIKVMNLSANTRANIKKNDPVILNAGYQGDVGCILVGKVAGLKHKQANVQPDCQHRNLPWSQRNALCPDQEIHS